MRGYAWALARVRLERGPRPRLHYYDRTKIQELPVRYTEGDVWILRRLKALVAKRLAFLNRVDYYPERNERYHAAKRLLVNYCALVRYPIERRQRPSKGLICEWPTLP